MARWLDPITSAVEEVVRERDAARTQAITNWTEVQRLREELRKAQQRITALEYRDRARFAPMARSGE